MSGGGPPRSPSGLMRAVGNTDAAAVDGAAAGVREVVGAHLRACDPARLRDERYLAALLDGIAREVRLPIANAIFRAFQRGVNVHTAGPDHERCTPAPVGTDDPPKDP